jgi:D-arabinono-1,4-lactone oxidase
MEKIRQEINRTDPDVPFRATTTYTHHTWAKTFQSRPELYIRPQSLEEIQKIVNLARRCRKRLVVVGCGHSPSDLTCTSSWMVNLDEYSSVLKVDAEKKTMLVAGGIRLGQLNEEAAKYGLTLPNLGSIDVQSIVGAIATGTHGSSLKHGLLSESVRSLRIVLSNGRAVRCSDEQNQELFRAGLVSLGALGIITEVEVQMVENYNVEWEQKLVSLDDVLSRWNGNLWTEREFTRVWWMPYMKRAIVWSAEKTDKPLRQPAETWYGGAIGFHTYHNLLALSNFVPWILPWVEWFVFGMQYGFSTGGSATAVEELRHALLLNCLYSQFVNEWALPLEKGPEAITRLSAWINREPGGGDIPFANKGVYVHCPIEVRASDSTYQGTTRPFLDNSCADGPTLYINATLYRAYLKDPPCRDQYYKAFEWLMREMGAKPHYAKNFMFTSSDQLRKLLGTGLEKWTKVRNEADPEGMFLGEWHRRSFGIGLGNEFPLEERELSRKKASNGGQIWIGEVAGAYSRSVEERPSEQTPPKPESPSAASSASSFDMMHGAEAEKSMLFNENGYDNEARYHGHPKEGITGTQVFDKM